MSINCEQFIFGSFKGVGYRFIKTANLYQMLSEKSIKYLKDLKGNSVIQTLLPENIVAVTYLNQGKDDYDRKTVWNHTFLLTIQDYFKLHESHDKELFEHFFYKSLDKPPRSLEPLKVTTK